MSRVHVQTDLKKILKGVSRSFYLSLALLPRKTAKPLSLAFLACKAADTIADTELISPGNRLALLNDYRELFSGVSAGEGKNIAAAIEKINGGSPAEIELIQNLPSLMSAVHGLPPKDWISVRELVSELTHGMQTDLRYFETGKLNAFETEKDLDRYIYHVAGCVGIFWTKITEHHFLFAKKLPANQAELGKKLGKGLQLVNILRDLPRDLQKGRCYIPKELLTRHRLTPDDLLKNENLPKAKPLLLQLSQYARELLRAGETYANNYPSYALRLKSVVRLPARLGKKTLDLLENSEDWLNPPAVHKVGRKTVYAVLLGSLLR